MLITQGDLIPVEPEATSVPWTRRKSQVIFFLNQSWIFKSFQWCAKSGFAEFPIPVEPEAISDPGTRRKFQVIFLLNQRLSLFLGLGEDSR